MAEDGSSTYELSQLPTFTFIMATLLNPRAPCLRQVAGSTFRAYAVLSRSQMATQYISASFARPLKQLCISSDRRGPVTSRDSSQRTPGLTTSALRHASTSGTSPNPQPTPPDLLTWDRFFKLRKTRRYINLGASVATAVPAVWFGMPYMVEKDLDSWAAQVSGLEPFIALPILGVLAAGAGWLCGPSFGTLGFKMWAGRRGWNQMIAEVCGHPSQQQHIAMEGG